MQIKYIRARHAGGRSVLVRPGIVGIFVDHGDHAYGDDQATVIDAPNAELCQSYIDGATMGWDEPEAAAAVAHYAKLADVEIVTHTVAPTRREVRQVEPVPRTVVDVTPVRDGKPDVFELASALQAALDLLDVARSLLDEHQQESAVSVIETGRELLAKMK